MISVSFIRTVFVSFMAGILLASHVQGQDLPDPRVDLNVRNTPLRDVLHLLELKTNFTFSYLNKELHLNASVTLNVKDTPLQQILEILSKRYALTFTTIKNIITVKENKDVDEENNQQGFGMLRGIVRDSVTSEVLPYASVYIREINSGASTDTRGFFVIPSLPTKKEYTIIVTYVGYSPKMATARIWENEITEIDVFLAKHAIEMESVNVYGERAKVEEVSVEKLAVQDIENMTHGVETDVMRTIQLEPGVQSTGDVSARYYVRGGASNENLVLLNGAPIYNPFHAEGIFSVIDPDMINSVEFYKGGFGARYDGRLSSVMNIVTKDGNPNSFGGTAALSELTAKGALEGPIPDGSFIITGRKSYFNEILKKFTNNESIPIDFYDASFKINYSNPEVLPLSKFSVFGFISNDKIDYKNSLHADYNWSNSNIGFDWFNAAQDDLSFVDFTFYYSGFSGSEIPYSSNDQYLDNKLGDFTSKIDFYHVYSNTDELYGGIKMYYIKTGLRLNNSTGILNTVSSEGEAFGAYGGYRLFSLSKLRVDLGSRFNFMNLLDVPSVFGEPRLNVTYGLLPTLNLKAAWGFYQQELVTITDEDEILPMFEPWIILPQYLKIPNAIHYVCGFDYYPTEKLKVDVEGYYKVEDHLAVINDSLIYPTDPQLIAASEKSDGAEITLNYETERIYAQLSYSYSWTTRKVRDMVYHPRFDSRNDVKFLADCDLGNNWSASMTWIFNSGMPFTQILGYYNKYDPSEISNPSSALTDYFYFPILAGRNAAQLPDYHRLDVGISKKIYLWSVKASLNLEIINVYDRKNFFYFDQETGKRVNMLPFFPTIDIKAEL
ncbi:MAG: carboxypeptidase-like regulatory domain-containing protein [Bacteroidota bacterium]